MSTKGMHWVMSQYLNKRVICFDSYDHEMKIIKINSENKCQK